jgi:hypothetical protein
MFKSAGMLYACKGVPGNAKAMGAHHRQRVEVDCACPKYFLPLFNFQESLPMSFSYTFFVNGAHTGQRERERER